MLTNDAGQKRYDAFAVCSSSLPSVGRGISISLALLLVWCGLSYIIII